MANDIQTKHERLVEESLRLRERAVKQAEDVKEAAEEIARRQADREAVTREAM